MWEIWSCCGTSPVPRSYWWRPTIIILSLWEVAPPTIKISWGVFSKEIGSSKSSMTVYSPSWRLRPLKATRLAALSPRWSAKCWAWMEITWARNKRVNSSIAWKVSTSYRSIFEKKICSMNICSLGFISKCYQLIKCSRITNSWKSYIYLSWISVKLIKILWI